MKLCLIVLIFAATSVSLVSCECRSPWRSRSDYTSLCKRWWRDAFFYDHDNYKRRDCIRKIQDKCPDYLASFTKKFEVTQEVKSDSIKWTVTSEAKLDGYNCIYYDVTMVTGICEGDDKGLGNCDFWWKAAIAKSSVNKIVNRCIGLIENECLNKLKQVSKTTQNTKHKKKSATAITITYKYNDESEELTFTRYVFN